MKDSLVEKEENKDISADTKKSPAVGVSILSGNDLSSKKQPPKKVIRCILKKEQNRPLFFQTNCIMVNFARKL